MDPWAASRRDVQFSLILNIRYQFAKTVKRHLRCLRPFSDSKYACCNAISCISSDRPCAQSGIEMAVRLISQMFIKRQELNVPASHRLRGRSISAAIAVGSGDGESMEPMAVMIGEVAARGGETDDVVC